MAEVLFEGTGLRIVKNTRNRFVIATLHHTADPAKQSTEWREEAAAGLTPAQFDREYNIDYLAVAGTKVFPEVEQHRALIVVEPPWPEPVDTDPMWAGFDYGVTNPSSFHVYAQIGEVFHSIWELYEPCKNLSAFVAKMMACPYWSRLRWIAADPSLWHRTQQTAKGLTSIATMIIEAGVRKLVAGNNDETAFIAAVHEHWRDLPDRPPTLRFRSCCVEQIREMRQLIYSGMSAAQALSRAYREDISSKENHSADDLKYFLNSVRGTRRRDRSNHRRPVDMAMWWSK